MGSVSLEMSHVQLLFLYWDKLYLELVPKQDKKVKIIVHEINEEGT